MYAEPLKKLLFIITIFKLTIVILINQCDYSQFEYTHFDYTYIEYSQNEYIHQYKVHFQLIYPYTLSDYVIFFRFDKILGNEFFLILPTIPNLGFCFPAEF